MRTIKNTLWITMALGLGLFLTACSDSDDSISAPVAGDSQVLIAHASPNAPGVAIVVDNASTAAVPNLQFPNNTGYVTLTAGTRNVKVNVAANDSTVIDADLALQAGLNYSVFAVGSVDDIEPLVLVDDLTAPAAGKAHVRFVHLSPNADSVDVALAGGAVVFGNVDFKEFLGFSPLDAATYDLEVRLAGTQTVVLPLPNITLEAGKIYTVFAKGFVGGAGAQALGAEIIVNVN